MDKTEKISIGHYVFTLDDKAYNVVSDYISTLENHYLKEDDGAEIMENIEERIAELLYERCGNEGVVSESDVRNVIGILGYPEAESAHTNAEASEEYAKSEKKETSGVYGKSDKTDETKGAKRPRRLYRDMENKRIAGVCGGLGKYLKADPIIFRLIFILLSVLPFFLVHMQSLCFTSVLLYLIMWIVMPKAETAKQRWELRGEDGSIDDLRRRAEYERQHGRGNRSTGQSRGCFLTGLGLLLLAIGSLGLLCVITTAIPFIFVSGAARWAALPFGFLGLSPFILNMLNVVLNPWMQSLIMVLTALPFIMMVYGGVILTFNLETPRWKPGLCMMILWFVLLFVTVPVSYYTTIRNINKLQESLPVEQVFQFSGNLLQDLDELGEWLEKHNFDIDETREFKEWLDEHNLNEESIPEIKEWLEKHNFAVPDSMRIEYNDSVFRMDVVDTTITIATQNV